MKFLFLGGRALLSKMCCDYTLVVVIMNLQIFEILINSINFGKVKILRAYLSFIIQKRQNCPNIERHLHDI